MHIFFKISYFLPLCTTLVQIVADYNSERMTTRAHQLLGWLTVAQRDTTISYGRGLLVVDLTDAG